MKTPDSRARFQAPSRHYHRARAEDTESAWQQWIGDDRKNRGRSRGILKASAWVLGILAFCSVIAVMCYQMS